MSSNRSRSNSYRSGRSRQDNTRGKAQDEKTLSKPSERIEYTKILSVSHSITLLEFLVNQLNTSRNNCKTLLSHHQVLVNGNVISQFDYLLGREDEIKIAKKPVSKITENKKQEKITWPAIDIIYEDDYFIAINKPAGLLSVESDTERISAYSLLSEFLQKEDKKARIYVIHRIDKETSGVLAFAKDPKVHTILRLNWNDYVKCRKYQAVVEGAMEKDHDTIISYLKENQNNMMYSSPDHHGDKAITHYTVVKSNREYSLLDIEIDTGRKNQIRVHMQDLHHPIVGDDKYGCQKNPLKRLGLHANYLALENPVTHEVLKLHAPTPRSFESVIR